jgi:cobalt/nickel transport system ATP-binding protein
MTLPIAQARALRYRYPDGSQALDGVDFDLYPRECVALFGANGSGKTTFALHLAGLLKGEGSLDVRGRVGIVFQDPNDQLFMPTVLEDVSFGPRNLGLSPDEATARATAALEQVDLSHVAERAPYHLSAGEKRRAAIAGVLAMQPDLLILDEPTTFLDPPAARTVAHLLSTLPQAKLLVTHDVSFARALATRAVFFEHGRAVATGPVDEIVTRFDWDFPPGASLGHRSAG